MKYTSCGATTIDGECRNRPNNAERPYAPSHCVVSLRQSRVKLMDSFFEFKLSYLIDDPPLVLGLFKMRIRKEEEHLFQLPFLEKIWQVLHGIGAKAGDVVVASRILKPQSSNSVLDVVRDLDPDFHTDHQLVRKHGRQLNEESAIATADVGKSHLTRMAKNEIIKYLTLVMS